MILPDHRSHHAGTNALQSQRKSIIWPVVFALFVACWLSFFFSHPTALNSVGVGHYRIQVGPDIFSEIWFSDTRAILASNDAVTAGADPYELNRLDYFGRPHSYGPLWLYLRHFGLTRADSFLVGLTLVGFFVAIAVAYLRPGSPGRVLWCIAVFCATPVLAAIERANNDLVIFLLLTPLVPCLLSARKPLRWLAIPMLVFATALKYYPIVAGIVLFANGSVRETRWRLIMTALASALVAWHVLLHVPNTKSLPAPHGILSFGGVAVFNEFGMHGIGPQLVVAGIGLVAIFLWWRSSVFSGWHPLAEMPRDWMYFILGGTVLSGCFFVGEHHAYRWIFAIWMAPLLPSLQNDIRVPQAVRTLARVTAALLLVMLWGEAMAVFLMRHWQYEVMLRAFHWVSLTMQPFTWAFFLCVLGFLTHFARSVIAPIVGLRGFVAGA
jgi:hypothetical protein